MSLPQEGLEMVDEVSSSLRTYRVARLDAALQANLELCGMEMPSASRGSHTRLTELRLNPDMTMTKPESTENFSYR